MLFVLFLDILLLYKNNCVYLRVGNNAKKQKYYEENLQRCINLDVRYMLFIIDKYAGASNLIKELKIVK